MRRGIEWTVAVLACAACARVVYAKRAGPGPGAVRAEYEKLVADGCDLDEHPVQTPIEARVLRNTPYAIAGRPFKSPELRDLFARDGDWYQPGDKLDVRIGKADARCVARLKKLEGRLRKRLPIDAKVEAVLTRHPTVFLQLRSSSNKNNRYRKASSKYVKDERAWQWGFEDGAACGDEACSSVLIECRLPEGARDGEWSKLECDVNWAG